MIVRQPKFDINSSSFGCLTPDDVYLVVDSYLNFAKNPIAQLYKSGITVLTTEPRCGHYQHCDWIAVHFHKKAVYSSLKEDIVAELTALSEDMERHFQEDLYKQAVECIQTAIQNSDMAQSYVGEPSRYPGLWKLAGSGTLTIDQLYKIIKRNGWN